MKDLNRNEMLEVLGGGKPQEDIDGAKAALYSAYAEVCPGGTNDPNQPPCQVGHE